MCKKLFLTFMALTALAALALPATASAVNKPTLKVGPNVVLEGSKIVGISVGKTYFTNTEDTANLLICESATMTGKVLKNKEGTIEGTIETTTWIGSDSGAHCTATWGKPTKPTTSAMCIKSDGTMATDEFQVFADNCSNSLTFTLDVTEVGECKYEATAGVRGHFFTGTDSAELKVTGKSAGSGMKKTSGSFLCPSSGALTMTFNLQTHDGTAVTIEKAP